MKLLLNNNIISILVFSYYFTTTFISRVVHLNVLQSGKT